MSRVEYIEIDLPVCSLTYGTAPCTAALGVTGDKKCFNSRKTCQDTANYDETTDTLRLSIRSLALNPEIIAIPNIEAISHTPGRLALGESIGARAVLSVTFRDHPFPDTGPGGDLYRDSRAYDPNTQGTFWGKVRARWPWLRGRALRWYVGDSSDQLAGMESRSYVIDRVEGPDTAGAVRIVAKDPLILIDDKRAQAPLLSQGELSIAISDSDTVVALGPAGIGDDEYPASGFVAIGGEEVCSFTRAGDIFTFVRGLRGTEAIAHDANTRVQLCLAYTSDSAADILYDLITEYSQTPASYINKDDWDDELSEFTPVYLYTALITEPTSVVELINEVLQQAGLTIWWDEIGATIRLQVLRFPAGTAFVYNDDHILAGTFSQKDQPDKRVSELWTYYDQISPIENLTERTNYRLAQLRVSTDSLTNHGEPAIRQIFSRWMPATAGAAVEALQEFILARFAEPPRVFTLDLLREPLLPTPALGQSISIESIFNQDDEGLPQLSVCQIIQLYATDSTWRVMAEEILRSDVDPPPPPVVGTYVVPIDSNVTNFNLRTEFLRWYGTEVTSGETVLCVVRSNVVVGSTTTGAPAWTTGSGWPAGVNLVLQIRAGAFVVGAGGSGGAARTASDFFSTNIFVYLTPPATAGGTAITVQYDIDITNDGVIGGGGGGGGGAVQKYDGLSAGGSFIKYAVQSSGGGGAGSTAGGAGIAASAGTYDIVIVRAGSNGALANGGSGGANAFADPPILTSGCAIISATGGAGGNLGQAGGNGIIAGGDALCTPTAITTGAAAGAAIVESGGTVTYTTRGDIRGAAPA
jgi:hypothetical protein